MCKWPRLRRSQTQTPPAAAHRPPFPGPRRLTREVQGKTRPCGPTRRGPSGCTFARFLPPRPDKRSGPALTRQEPRAAPFGPGKRTRNRPGGRGCRSGRARPARAPAGSSSAGTHCRRPPWREAAQLYWHSNYRRRGRRHRKPPSAAPEQLSLGAPAWGGETPSPGRHRAAERGQSGALPSQGTLGDVVSAGRCGPSSPGGRKEIPRSRDSGRCAVWLLRYGLNRLRRLRGRWGLRWGDGAAAPGKRGPRLSAAPRGFPLLWWGPWALRPPRLPGCRRPQPVWCGGRGGLCRLRERAYPACLCHGQQFHHRPLRATAWQLQRPPGCGRAGAPGGLGEAARACQGWHSLPLHWCLVAPAGLSPEKPNGYL